MQVFNWRKIHFQLDDFLEQWEEGRAGRDCEAWIIDAEVGSVWAGTYFYCFLFQPFLDFYGELFWENLSVVWKSIANMFFLQILCMDDF